MRALLALLLLAGCDRVFGLGDPYQDAPPTPGSADASAADAPVMADALIDAPQRLPTPLLHYRFDGNYQEAGGGMNASCVTSGGAICSFDPGKYGSALHLDGSSISHITLPSLPTSFTLMMWIGNASGPALDLAQTATGGSRDVWLLDTGSSIAFSSLSGTTVQMSAGSRPVEPWTHIAITYDGVTQILYVDGVVEAMTSVGAIGYGANNVTCLGCRMSTVTSYFAGTIDDVYVFGSALTQFDIAAYAFTAH